MSLDFIKELETEDVSSIRLEDELESLKMLETKVGQSNAVFACFGSAAQQCQYFEAALGDFLLVINKIRTTPLTLQDMEVRGLKPQKQTMGMLLKEFKKYVKFDDDGIIKYMNDALEKRNFLMHHFFRERDIKLSTQQGRMEMLHELVSIDNQMRAAMKITYGMRSALMQALDSISVVEGADGVNQAERDTDGRVLFSAQLMI